MHSEHFPDFGQIIDRAIARNTRSRLAEFLGQFQHVEFGRTRSLTAEELALVLTCFDHFLLNDSVTKIGTIELTQLRKRLLQIAQHQGPLPSDMVTLIRNSCFDSLACISALEARLCRTLDRAEVRVAIGSGKQSAANDV